MYNYNHLYYFYTAAKFKSITKASGFLTISQPSLSAQVKALEESLGLELFIRHGRSLELTDKGETIYNICEDMFRGSMAIKNLLQSNKNLSPSINIGVSNQIERPYIADIIGKLIFKSSDHNRPLIRMTNLERNAGVIEKYDLLINHKKESLKSHKIINLSFPVALIGQKSILRKNGASIRNIKSFLKNYEKGIVLPTEDFNLRKEADKFMSKEQCQYRIVFESDNMAANIRAVIDGAGIGFFPINYVSKEIKNKNLDYYMPPGGIWNHNLYLQFSERKIVDSTTEQLIDLFVQSARSFSM